MTMVLASRDVDISGLASQWDADPEIRGRLREGGFLIHPETNKKILIKTASLNKGVLQPLLEMMAPASGDANGGKCSPSPGVEEIREEVKALLDMNKRQVDFETVDREAWTIQRFLAFIKLKIRKREVSTDTYLNIDFFSPDSCYSLTSCPSNLNRVKCPCQDLSQDKNFQDLVLILDPLLQATCPHSWLSSVVQPIVLPVMTERVSCHKFDFRRKWWTS